MEFPVEIVDEGEGEPNKINCPVCNREFRKTVIEGHVDKCLFLNTLCTQEQQPNTKRKRSGSHLPSSSSQEKRVRISEKGPAILNKEPQPQSTYSPQPSTSTTKTTAEIRAESRESKTPLAEQMRPKSLDDLVGQREAFGAGSLLRIMLEKKQIPNMILWGPPGCGKTSLANVVANICKEQNNLRFVKLSATTSGINDVKEAVKVAQNEVQFKRQTVLFMDEIHRFNKLQQDTFLPHVENGTITLIGATTENPSFSLNNALLSRCRVVVMEKLNVQDVTLILEKALQKGQQAFITDANRNPETKLGDNNISLIPKYLVERATIQWLAEVCDGDARVALGALELALKARDPGDTVHTIGPAVLTLEDVKNGIKRSHMVYDRQGEEHYNMISALHKSIRASDDNAALYWTTRMLRGGEDPLFIARRLIRAASEDIGLADPNALVESIACLQGCQHIGMPECDVLLAQCAVRLARAPKSTEVYHALNRCKRMINNAKGPLPPVPLHLRNAPTKLMKELGYGAGYNGFHKDQSGLTYMPEDIKDVDFFNENQDEDAIAPIIVQNETREEEQFNVITVVGQTKMEQEEQLNADAADDSIETAITTMIQTLIKHDHQYTTNVVEQNKTDQENQKTNATNVGDEYSQLMELEQQALIVNTEPFECGVCMDTYAASKGAVLHECVHVFCKECLADHIKHCEDAAISCPAMGCAGTLQEREIRALVTTDEYEKWLARGLAVAESGTRNAFHCRTRDCTGWALCDPGVLTFPCPVCKQMNCIPCQNIHEGMTCKQFQAKQKAKKTPSKSTEERTEAYLEKIISKGQALKCPECNAVITRISGCDWIQCTACKTEICWVTRGRRWGPKGRGDISGGCRCMVKGKRCHPSCQNCH